MNSNQKPAGKKSTTQSPRRKREIPAEFAQNTLDLFGERGAAWLKNLPDLLDACEQRWSIQVLAPFPLSYNYVAPVVRACGSPAVLKLWVPNAEMRSEMEALRIFDGRGIARLLDHDPEQGIMLLERLEPGEPLATVEDDEAATRIAAGVMRALWRPAPDDPQGLLCRAEKWVRGLGRLRETFGGGTGPFPAALVDRAERLAEDLLASAGPMRLLHGDFHHWNVLSAQRAPWLAMDPKGVIGEAEYEVCPFMLNRLPETGGKQDIQRVLLRRAAVLEEMLGFERGRVLAWAAFHAVLSNWWTYEDHHRVDAEGLLHMEAAMELVP